MNDCGFWTSAVSRVLYFIDKYLDHLESVALMEILSRLRVWELWTSNTNDIIWKWVGNKNYKNGIIVIIVEMKLELEITKNID